MTTRQSGRKNKGQPPSHLTKDYVTEISSSDFKDNSERNSSDSSSDVDDDLESTIVVTDAIEDGQDKMADDIKALLATLSQQFATMKTELTEQNNVLQKNLDDQSAKLEATNKQLAEFQQAMKTSNESQLNSSAAPFNPTTTVPSSVSVASSTPILSTATNNTPTNTINQVAGFSGNLLNQTTELQHTTTMHPSHTNFNAPYLTRKYLVPLKKFSGDPCQWMSFAAEYRRTTVDYNYSSAENTTRLSDCLVGEARTMVFWLLNHDDLADKIMERLGGRYGRPELVADSQIKNLKKWRSIPETDIRQVVSFADDVINFSHFMQKSENSQHHLMNPILLQELVSKLPIHMQINWGNHSSSLPGIYTIMDFSNWIEIQADNIARVTSFGLVKLQPEKKVTSRKGQTFHATSTSTSKPTEKRGVCIS